MTIDNLKERLRALLIEHNGDIAPHQLKGIVEDAKSLGMDERQIAMLVPETDKTIDWKEVKVKNTTLDCEDGGNQSNAVNEPLISIDDLIGALMKSTLTPEAIEMVLKIVAKQKQDKKVIARKVIDELPDNLPFGEYVVPQNIEMHTNVARLLGEGNTRKTQKLFQEFNTNEQQQYHPTIDSEEKLDEILSLVHLEQSIEKDADDKTIDSRQAPKIHYFNADKLSITKGEKVAISWKVSGVKIVNITGLGDIKILEGEQIFAPGKDINYIMTVGKLSVNRMVKVKRRNLW